MRHRFLQMNYSRCDEEHETQEQACDDDQHDVAHYSSPAEGDVTIQDGGGGVTICDQLYGLG